MGIFNWAKNKSARMVGYERIKEDSKLIYEAVKQIKDNTPDENYNEKLKKLTSKDVEDKKRLYLNFFRLGLTAAFLIIIFSVYSLCNHEYIKAISSIIVAGIPFIQAVKYHYWYTLLKDKKFKSFKDYLDSFKKELK